MCPSCGWQVPNIEVPSADPGYDEFEYIQWLNDKSPAYYLGTLYLKSRERRMTHIYVWENNPKRASLKDRYCFIKAKTKNQSTLVVEFEDGQTEVINRRSIRKIRSEQFHRQPCVIFSCLECDTIYGSLL